MNGRRRSGGFRKRRTTGVLSRIARSALRKVGRRLVAKPKFATVGFNRNVERKYFDKTYQSNNAESQTGNTITTNLINGITFISNAWQDYTFGGQQTPSNISNDMCKGLNTGTNARTRIGNKIKINYLKGAFTFLAAVTDNTMKEQNGEVYSVTSASGTSAYLRTTYRMMLVKDLQVNSTNAQITWDNVMDTSNLQAGVHSELNVDNMGRFIILSDQIFTLDADTPMKTIPFMLKGSQVGNVRYNGPTGAALTDKGYYIIWAAFVLGGNIPTTSIHCTGPTGHSRLCFTDD